MKRNKYFLSATTKLTFCLFLAAGITLSGCTRGTINVQTVVGNEAPINESAELIAYGQNSDPAAASQGGAMRMRIIIGANTLTATMADNATARDFMSLLPLTLTMEDFNRIEKISFLPRSLTTAGAPPGFQPSMGDITLFAPWGNLAIFYEDFRFANGLIFLGRIDGDGIEAFNVEGSLTATFEVLE
ncbi:MAG: cyclophilin-like fold protein [Spirochaetes bacterium]|nr:cyclophilin-like fold protein [Spirochaetota bacterium]